MPEPRRPTPQYPQTHVNIQEAARQRRRLEKKAEAQRKQRERERHEQKTVEAAKETEKLQERFRELNEILADALSASHAIDFEALSAVEIPGPPPPTELEVPLPLPDLLDAPRRSGVLGRLIPGAERKREQLVSECESENSRRTDEWRDKERQRVALLAEHKKNHEELRQQALAERDRRRQEIDELRADWAEGRPEAVANCAEFASLASAVPKGCDLHPIFQYDTEANTLIGQIDLPDLDVIPEFKNQRYVKTRSATELTNQVKAAERNKLYHRIICSLALRTAHAVFSTDPRRNIPMLVLNGIVNGVDKATGRDVREVLISFSMTREQYDQLDLARVEPTETLKWLKAKVSPKPHTFAPVQPVLEFQMLDKRFIDAADIIGSLTSRMNLMDLNYNEFEDLVTSLFNHMGYDSIGTRRSHDGGVDSIVYHHDPVFGGKVIVQAKHYTAKIGPGHVRELIGSLTIEKASKAILVTTSDFTDEARALKAEYENIELINGNNLLQLLADHAKIEARIDM